MDQRILIIGHDFRTPSTLAEVLEVIQAERDAVEIAQLCEPLRPPEHAIQELLLTCPRIEMPPLPFDPPRAHGKRAQRRRAKGW